MITPKEIDKSARNIRVFCKRAFASFVIYGAAIIVSVIANIFSITFIPFTMCLGFLLLIAASMYFACDVSESDTDIIRGNSDISVYSSYDSDEERLCRRILSGNHNLELRNINYICKLISQL